MLIIPWDFREPNGHRFAALFADLLNQFGLFCYQFDVTVFPALRS